MILFIYFVKHVLQIPNDDLLKIPLPKRLSFNFGVWLYTFPTNKWYTNGQKLCTIICLSCFYEAEFFDTPDTDI